MSCQFDEISLQLCLNESKTDQNRVNESKIDH